MNTCPKCHRHVLESSCTFCASTTRHRAKWSVGAALAAAMMACGGTETSSTTPEADQAEVQPEETAPSEVPGSDTEEANSDTGDADGNGEAEPVEPDPPVVAMYGVAP